MRKSPFHIHSFCLIILLIIVPAGTALAGDMADRDRQLHFADGLFDEGDFFRAITEYKRLISFYPEAQSLCEHARFRIAMSYQGARRYEEAIAAFNRFLELYPGSARASDARFHRGIAEKELHRFTDALSSFQEIIDSDFGAYRHKALYERALIFVNRGEWGRARESFLAIPPSSTLYPSSSVFSQGLEHVDDIPHKSPALAGTLAALVPGAGHLYTERPRDALVAFLLNGAFILAAVELFDDDQYIAGGVVTFFELGWYSGNIYSAVSSAHKYNRRSQNDFIRGLKERGGLSFRYDHDRSDGYLVFSMRF